MLLLAPPTRAPCDARAARARRHGPDRTVLRLGGGAPFETTLSSSVSHLPFQISEKRDIIRRMAAGEIADVHLGAIDRSIAIMEMLNAYK